jgi:sigma-B regulation protein RsbU (phosphoserine phosphatase)
MDADRETARRRYREHVLMRKIAVPRYRVAQHLEPLEEVGGDILWHREYPEGTADVVHADVSGHGEDAGRHAAKMVLLLDNAANTTSTVSDVVAGVNRVMVENNTEDAIVFATGLFFRFHAEAQRLTCVNFGHLGPIFSRSGVIYLDSGLPVGAVGETEAWPETEIRLSEHGNQFLVYSDGIVEQFNMDGEMFGTERLLQSFLSRLGLPLDRMVNGIVSELAAFRGDAIVKDDQTLLALQFINADPGPAG